MPARTVEAVAGTEGSLRTQPRPAIALEHASVSFGSPAGGHLVLSDISFEVAEAEFVCVIGPSGCGKTTLLRLLAGLIPQFGGGVLFRGHAITGPSRDRAIVFQDYSKALLPWRTVAGNIAFSLEACGVTEPQLSERIDALLEKMGLRQAARKFPSQLSGGMQQRVQIARCLAQQPKLLLMDEPFGALDALTRQTLQDEVARLAMEQRMTVVFITHDLEEAIYLGDRVIALGTNPGRVAETIDVGIPRPRNQLETREDRRFLAHRHRLFGLLQPH